ncbi:MAG: flagellar motor switch protein FliM [Alicyclobacillus sp.]|nr:flagellar motor switch protein FliM [Alicyclobacillus sp.]
MSEILSQAEIDALLSALNSGEVKAEDIREDPQTNRVRSYDFRRAMRFSKDHMRIVERIHEHFCRLLGTYFSAQLRSVVQLTVETVDQVPYEEFIRSIPIPSVVQVVEVAPLPGRIVVEFHPQVVFAMLDRMMGGTVKGRYRDRELTEIEQSLFRRLVHNIPVYLTEVWENVIHLEPRLLHLESNPQFLQLTTPNETVLVVTISARVGATTGFLTVCIPHLTVEPVMSKLSAQRLLGAARSVGDDGHTQAAVTNHLAYAAVEVAAVLGAADLSLEELLNLEVGDVIPLAAPIRNPIAVSVNGIPTYLGAVGKLHKHYAVRIVGEWKEVESVAARRETFASGD